MAVKPDSDGLGGFPSIHLLSHVPAQLAVLLEEAKNVYDILHLLWDTRRALSLCLKGSKWSVQKLSWICRKTGIQTYMRCRRTSALNDKEI